MRKINKISLKKITKKKNRRVSNRSYFHGFYHLTILRATFHLPPRMPAGWRPDVRPPPLRRTTWIASDSNCSLYLFHQSSNLCPSTPGVKKKNGRNLNAEDRYKLWIRKMVARTIIAVVVAAMSVEQLLAQSSLSQSFDQGWLFYRGPDPSSSQSKCTDKDFPIGKRLPCVEFYVFSCF